jgi:hypothetical protein
VRGKINISHIDHISEIMTAHIINIANIMYISTKKRGRGQTGLVSTTSPESAFSGRTLCQLTPPKDDYQSAILIIIVFFWGAKSFNRSKRHGLGSSRYTPLHCQIVTAILDYSKMNSIQLSLIPLKSRVPTSAAYEYNNNRPTTCPYPELHWTAPVALPLPRSSRHRARSSSGVSRDALPQRTMKPPTPR